MPEAVDYALVMALGALVGVAELTSRYRDAPFRAVVTFPALVYIALNLGSSAMALALIHGFGWTVGPGPGNQRWAQVLVAGLGAMALFRASFSVRAGDHDIGVSPGSFFQIFRDAADRAVDRMRAKARGPLVSTLMDGIDYQKAREGLIPYCLALMQNVPDEEQKKLTYTVDLLTEEQVDDPIKVRILGLHLMNVVGPDVLRAAVDALRDELK